MAKRIKSEEIRELARGRWIEILGALAGAVLGEALEHKPGTHVRCPFHGGEKDFRLDGPRSRFGTAAENGGAICTCGAWKDGFALLMKANGWTFQETLVRVARYLGLEVDEHGRLQDERRQRERLHRARAKARRAEQARAARRAREDRRSIARIREAWDQAVPLTDPRAEPVRQYLASRKLSVQQLLECPDVRCHPALPFFERTAQGMECLGAFPAMLSMVRDAEGAPVTLHRTYLTPRGAKLPVEKPKKLMAYPSSRTLTGGAIRLFRAEKVLGIAEGIETAMACQYAMGVPVWAAVSASLLAAFEPPPGVKALVIWADKDRSEAGIEAARVLKRRMWKAGIRCRIEQPEYPIPEGAKGIDWCDVWAHTGRIGFPVWPRHRQGRCA